MKTYKIQFTGRKVRAIGSFGQCEAIRNAPNPDAAILAVYDEYEHLSKVSVSEIVTPHGLEKIAFSQPYEVRCDTKGAR